LILKLTASLFTLTLQEEEMLSIGARSPGPEERALPRQDAAREPLIGHA